MRYYYDAFDFALRGLRELQAEHDRAFAARLAQLVAEATWRLNETEHALQYHALGYSAQWFTYPYGARRANGEHPGNQAEYLATLPVEHRGDASRAEVNMLYSQAYEVHNYLDFVKFKDEIWAEIREKFRLNWLGIWVRK